MTDADQVQLASTLSVDAKYVEECLERFRPIGEVHFSVASVEFLLANYRLAIKALVGEVEEVKPVEHPSLRGAEQLKAAREEAEQQMASASAAVKAVLDSVRQGG